MSIHASRTVTIKKFQLDSQVVGIDSGPPVVPELPAPLGPSCSLCILLLAEADVEALPDSGFEVGESIAFKGMSCTLRVKDVQFVQGGLRIQQLQKVSCLLALPANILANRLVRQQVQGRRMIGPTFALAAKCGCSKASINAWKAGSFVSPVPCCQHWTPVKEPATPNQVKKQAAKDESKL